MPTPPVAGSTPSPRLPGGAVVLGLLAVGIGLATFALAFQWRQTRGCLGFYGSRLARAISTAPRVEVWWLSAGRVPGRLVAVERCDVSRAAGLVHLRRGLVEDANFNWTPPPAAAPLPQASWTVALAFFADPQGEPTGILAIGAEPAGGSLCVVGRPGRIGLGRLERGLRTWIAAACPDAAGQGGRQP